MASELHANGTWQDVLVDAAIAAGAAFFGALTGVALVDIRVNPGTFLLAGAIAAGTAFFGSLIASRRRTPVR